MTKRDIDPTIKRSLAESVAHNGEARRLTAELARARGVAVPVAPPLPNEFEEELITARHDIEELKKGMASRPTNPSNPELSLRVPGGSSIRVAGLIGWQIMVILVALGALAAWAWVQTHSITIATPVTLPAAPAHS